MPTENQNTPSGNPATNPNPTGSPENLQNTPPPNQQDEPAPAPIHQPTPEPAVKPGDDAGNEFISKLAEGVEFTDEDGEEFKAIQKHPALRDIKDVKGLLKSYVSAQKMLGRPDKITLPDKDAPDSEWRKVFERLGMPGDAEKYELPERQDGIKPDERFTNAFKQAAHEAGLNKKQAAIVYQRYLDSVAEFNQESEKLSAEYVEQNEKALEKEWGDALSQNVDLAKNAVQVAASKIFKNDQEYDDFVEHAKARGWTNDAYFVRLMHHFGRQMAQDDIPAGGATQGFTPSPEEARVELRDFDLNPELRKAYMSKDHPRHNEVVQMRERLYTLAYGKEPANMNVQ